MESRDLSNIDSFGANNVQSAGLRLLMSQLNDCLQDDRMHHGSMAHARIAAILEQLVSRLSQYAIDLEHGGPLHDAMQSNPWLTTRIQQLRQHQEELDVTLRSLLEVSRNEHEWSLCYPQLHWKLDHFVERCLQFDAAVQNVLHEAFPGPAWLQDVNGDPLFS